MHLNFQTYLRNFSFPRKFGVYGKLKETRNENWKKRR